LKIAITGGRGLQGSHLAERLHSEGHYVLILDNSSTGRNWPKCSESRIIDLRRTAPDLSDYDAVFHLAANVGGLEHLHGLNESRVVMDNMLIDANVVDSAISGGVKKFIFASSCDAILAHGGYGRTKKATELLLRGSGMAVSILRLFNVYGPGERYSEGSHVVPELIRKALFEEEIEVYGDGSQTRCFLYVEDAVDAYIRALHVDYEWPVEIGNEEEVSIGELAGRIRKLAGREVPIRFNEEKPVGPMMVRPYVRKGEEVLGWKAKTPLQEGLKATMDWIRNDSASPVR
jgi:nucleoside-diphosphate-sugar epimerase